MKPSTTILGAAGEHFVMCQLLRCGLIAALAPIGVPNADIVVTDSIGDRLCAVQVKARTAKGSDGGWHMGINHEKLISPTLFYCFVDFGQTNIDPPRTWIVPSVVVADVLKRSHQSWLSSPGKAGHVRNDSDMRRFLPDYTKFGLLDRADGWLTVYRDAWHQIESASEAIVSR